MDQSSVTWDVAADAAEAWIFCDRARVDPRERKHDDPEALRQHLRQARARNWS